MEVCGFVVFFHEPLCMYSCVDLWVLWFVCVVLCAFLWRYGEFVVF